MKKNAGREGTAPRLYRFFKTLHILQLGYGQYTHPPPPNLVPLTHQQGYFRPPVRYHVCTQLVGGTLYPKVRQSTQRVPS